MHQSHQGGKRCRVCFALLIASQTFLELLFGQDLLCYDCRKLLVVKKQRVLISGMSLLSFYEYKDEARRLFLQFKEGHDRMLGPIFLVNYGRMLQRQYRKHQIVPVPSHELANQRRGFFVLEELFGTIFTQGFTPVFKKRHDIYQKKLDKEARLEAVDNFDVDFSSLNKDMPVLLVDDCVTTGTTLLWLYGYLVDAGYRVEVLTVYYHPLLMKEKSYEKSKVFDDYLVVVKGTKNNLVQWVKNFMKFM